MSFPEFGTIVDEKPKEFGTIVESKSPKEEIQRKVGALGLRGAEAAIGKYGDIINLPQNLIKFLDKALTGQGTLGLEQSLNIARKALPGGQAPTTQELRKITKGISGEKFEPQSSGEEFGQEFLQDVVSLSGGKSLLRPFIVSGTGNLAKEAIKELGGGETAQNIGKIGTMIITSLFNPRGAEKYIKDLYSKAESAVPKGIKVNANKLVVKLTDLRNKLTKGTLAPSEKVVVDEIDEILKKVKNGEIEVEELIASKRSGNEKMQEFLFKTPDRKARAGARRFFLKINKDVKDELSDYGKSNPEFGKNFTAAEEGFATIAKSKTISNFIKRHASTLSKTGAGALAIQALKNPAALIPTLKGAAIATGVLKGGEFFARLFAKSPVLRGYYFKALKAAGEENAKALNRSIEQMETEIEKNQ